MSTPIFAANWKMHLGPDAAREFLDPDQVVALKERRKRLVDHIQQLIDTRGEGIVLY